MNKNFYSKQDERVFDEFQRVAIENGWEYVKIVNRLDFNDNEIYLIETGRMSPAGIDFGISINMEKNGTISDLRDELVDVYRQYNACDDMGQCRAYVKELIEKLEKEKK